MAPVRLGRNGLWKVITRLGSLQNWPGEETFPPDNKTRR